MSARAVPAKAAFLPLLAAALLAGATPAAAHPHVWMETSVDVVFDPDGRFTSVHE